MISFRHVLINTLIAGITTNFLWFAMTFWIYLETQSILATSLLGGSYMLLTSFTSLIFGTFVDKHKKNYVLVLSTSVTMAAFIFASIIYFFLPAKTILELGSPYFWLFTIGVLIGAIAGNMRAIALTTIVTLLVPSDERDKANGLVGATNGVSFVITSVFSGLAIGYLGMSGSLIITLLLILGVLIHLQFISIPEEQQHHQVDLQKKHIDIREAINTIVAIPGLKYLIIFNVFNNLIGGVFMSLIDPYGLTLFSVKTWGFVLGITSTGFILGGMVVAKLGLGKRPLYILMMINIVIGIVSILFGIREIAWLYIGGIFIYMCLTPIVEATEQTILQKLVPYQKQGRVFGFAQSIESAAAPISAFAIGPITQYVLIPYMNGAGELQLAWFLGRGEARAIALVFVAAGLLLITLATFTLLSPAYQLLSKEYEKT